MSDFQNINEFSDFHIFNPEKITKNKAKSRHLI